MPPNPVIIFTAIEMERKAVLHAVQRAAAAGRLDGGCLEVRSIGISASRLPEALPTGTRLVLLAGLAGGLDPAVRRGDVVVDLAEWPSAPAAVGPTHLTRVGDRFVHFGRLHTVDIPVTTAAAKADLLLQTHALAVEMEGRAVRRLGVSAGVPVLHVRAISDAADDALDPRLLTLVDDLGRPRPLHVAWYLLRHPTRVPAMARLGRLANDAASMLGQAVVELLCLLDREPDAR